MAESSLEKLGRRTYDSYVARLYARRRLHSLGAWWDAAGYSSGTSILAVSILLLGVSGRDAGGVIPGSELVLAVASLVALIVSIVSSRLEYEARAKLMFINYRELQRLSVRVEADLDGGKRVTDRQTRDLQDEYQNLLDAAENHTPIDHALAKVDGSWSRLRPALIVRALRPYVLPLFVVAGSLVAIVWVAIVTIASLAS